MTTTFELRDSSVIRSRYIRKMVYLQFHNANDHQTWWGYKLEWRCPTYFFKKIVDHMTICFSKNAIYPLTQEHRNQLEIPNIKKLTNPKLFLLFKKCYHLTYIDIHHFKGPLSDLRQFLTTDSPLKMMKSAFLSRFFGYVYVLIRKLRLISKFITSLPGQQIMAIYII